MANSVNRNQVYIDTGGVALSAFTAVKPNINLIIVTPTAAGAIFKLRDTNVSGNILVDLRDATTSTFNWVGRSIIVPFSPSDPMQISQTLYVDTVTNCTAILVGDFYTKV